MRLRPVGGRALLLEADAPGEVAGWLSAVRALVARGDLPAPDDVVPGARTLLLDGVDPALAARLLGAVRPDGPGPEPAASPAVQVPVVYDGADLADVAAHWGTDVQGVVAAHTGADWQVAFCGFAPGFPYLVGLPDALPDVPRRSSPRTRVPAGSVALARRWTGIYPGASPGGWQLLGRTGVRLFDVDRDPPALLAPGTRVRFVAVPELPVLEITAPSRRPPARAADAGPRALTVVRPGPRTTVQDRGRPGLAHLGVPRSGALDGPAAALANRLVGNDPDAAVLETTLGGVALRAGAWLTVAVTGAPATVTAGGRAVDTGVAVALGPGQVLEVGPATAGVRSYVAVAGGVAVPSVLGSRSTDTLSGTGPAPLAVGDVLPVGPATALPPGVDATAAPVPPDVVVLPLRPGPRDDEFDGLAVLLSGTYRVSADSDRVGARLVGPALLRVRRGELESEGLVLGAVQVPPDGQPVVLLADHPTTGGYPVAGTVSPAGLARLAQARPGTCVRFVLQGDP